MRNWKKAAASWATVPALLLSGCGGSAESCELYGETDGEGTKE